MSRKNFTPPQPSPMPWGGSKKFTNDLGLLYQGCIYPRTFYPDIFDENASLQLMSFGNPLFEEMLEDLALVPNSP